MYASFRGLNNLKLIVGCRGVVQLGGPDPWVNRGGPTKVGAHKSFLFTESSLVVEIKNNWLIFCILTLFYINLLQCSTWWQSGFCNFCSSKYTKIKTSCQLPND